MNEQKYVLVLGASGNIGGKIAQELLSKGATVGVVGRDFSRLKKFEGKADIWAGDFMDDAFLEKAFNKATSLFLTVPDACFSDPAATALRLGKLLKGSKITHIVNISNSIVKKGGVATRLVALEQELDKIPGVNIKHLRSANFFENLHWGLHTPYNPDLQLPYISSYEVAYVAAEYLYQQNFEGKSVKVLLGSRDYSMAELAAAAGVVYEQQPYTAENVGFYKPFNEGDFEVEPRTALNTSQSSDPKYTLQYFLEQDLK
ncbi:SDR family NAD(P)-dependent oxidoreductase [Pontibacter locisalis]|uniref:SDR family NAD(P)-dependent oxidoreductase n=1 Tax=Pontibacter locisalis TaxID=1719035 RepID=A0ABW5IJE0_9BACT